MTNKLKSSSRPSPGKLILGLVAVSALIVLVFYFLHRGRESTDDAFIEGHVMQISPQIAGAVIHVLVNDNQEVKAGDLLVELDPRENKAVYDEAMANFDSAQAKFTEAEAKLVSTQAALSEAQADVEEARANADNAAKEQVRGQELRTRGVTSQQDLDRVQSSALGTKAALDSKTKKALGTESDVKVMAADVKAAQAQVELAKALIDTAKLRLSYTQIHAPESGRITRKNVEVGNYVQTGALLMAVVPDEMWVVANFKETQLRSMRPGQPVKIYVDAYPALKLHGVVDSVQSGTGSRFSLLPAENATGNYIKVVQRVPVKILLQDIPKDAPVLAPGMSVIPTVDVRH